MDYDPDDVTWSPASWLGSYANILYNDYLDCRELQNVPTDSQLSAEQRLQFRRLQAIAETLTPRLHSLRAGPQVVNGVRVCPRGCV